MEIYHTINSGLLFRENNQQIMVDVLHCKTQGYSDIPWLVKKQVFEDTGLFSQADALVFTHAHPDHYDPQLVSIFCRKHPGTPVILPGKYENCKLIKHKNEIERFEIGDFSIVLIKTIHDGEIFREVIHNSLLIGTGGKYAFVSGDAELTEADCNRIASIAQPYMGFFNAYQISRPAVHRLIAATKMEHLFLYHLCYKEDDEFSGRDFAERMLRMFPQSLPNLKLLEPMRWIV